MQEFLFVVQGFLLFTGKLDLFVGDLILLYGLQYFHSLQGLTIPFSTSGLLAVLRIL